MNRGINMTSNQNISTMPLAPTGKEGAFGSSFHEWNSARFQLINCSQVCAKDQAHGIKKGTRPQGEGKIWDSIHHTLLTAHHFNEQPKLQCF